ncbi:hypothetical protein ACUXZZ_45115 (plasmid) [Streptomyces graminifolii]|uniref:hypothetical protein n=1 Tax=Streptomyces graminifolii TaxID=1266771 RepID=UPI004057F3D8
MPGFTATTQAIIEVLASRMNYDTGHARYVLRDVMERTGLGRTAVTDHVKMLRAGGWLAWVEHGSLRNALTRLGVGGYARTATVYAATIPPAYDTLVGNILVGTGYDARIIVDYRPKSPVDTAGNEAVENSGAPETRTPSLWVDKEVGQVQVVGTKDSSTGQARTVFEIPRRKKKHTVTGYRITGERIERARKIAKWVRPLVNWLQGATLDQLSWVLLDLVARDWTDNQILVWLGRLGQKIGAAHWRPQFPHRVIAAALHRKDEADTRKAHGYTEPDQDALRATTAPHAEFGEAREAVRTIGDEAQAHITPSLPDEDCQLNFTNAEMQAAAKADPRLVIAVAEFAGRDAALSVYGTVGAEILAAHDEYTAAAWPKPRATAGRSTALATA